MCFLWLIFSLPQHTFDKETFVKLLKNGIICVISQEGRLKTYNRAVIHVNTCVVFVSTFLWSMLHCILLHVSSNGLVLKRTFNKETFVKLFKNRIICVISQEGRLKTDNRTVKVVITYLGGFRITLWCILCSTALHVNYNSLGDVCKIIKVQNNFMVR